MAFPKEEIILVKILRGFRIGGKEGSCRKVKSSLELPRMKAT